MIFPAFGGKSRFSSHWHDANDNVIRVVPPTAPPEAISSHVPPVLPAHLVQGRRDLAEGADPNRVQEGGKDVVAGERDSFQPGQLLRSGRPVASLEIPQTGDLGAFFIVAGTGQRYLRRHAEYQLREVLTPTMG